MSTRSRRARAPGRRVAPSPRPAEAPTVGFIGTFGLWHGVRVLPEIIAGVASARDDVRWIIVGAGALFDEVRADIERRGLLDRVELTGVVPHERAVELLAACDVCVSPHVPNPDGTRFFGSPTKLFEYMGLGKAIVASDLEQIGEVIEHERTGLLCPPGDAEAAAARSSGYSATRRCASGWARPRSTRRGRPTAGTRTPGASWTRPSVFRVGRLRDVRRRRRVPVKRLALHPRRGGNHDRERREACDGDSEHRPTRAGRPVGAAERTRVGQCRRPRTQHGATGENRGQ